MASRTRTKKRKDHAVTNPELLTMPEAAASLRVSMRTLQEWVKDKAIPHIKFGPKAIRFDPIDIAAHKAKCRVSTADVAKAADAAKSTAPAA